MLNRLAKLFGFRLVKIETEPQTVVRAFADEIEAVLITNKDFTDWRHKDSFINPAAEYAGKLDYALLHRFSTETIRETAAEVAACMLAVAYHEGELLPESNDANRKR